MDQPGSLSPDSPPSASTTRNAVVAVVAVGQKVKSILSTNQRPSVRILRTPLSTKGIAEKLASQLSSHGPAQRLEIRAELAEHCMPHAEVYRAPLKENPSANRFRDARNRAGAAIWSLFGHGEVFTDDESFEHDYDPDTVDLLDVVGMYD
jgi:hypothetical protein